MLQIKDIVQTHVNRIEGRYELYRKTGWFKIAIAILFVLCLTGVVDKVINVTVKNKLDNLNQNYIDHELKVVRENFLVLSGIDAGLAILKSSQAGFTFIIKLQTQFGNIIEPLYRTVTKAWMVSFASLCSLGVIELSYKLVDKLGSFFLTLLVGFYFCLLFVNSKGKSILQSILVAGQRIAALLVICGYIVLPGYLLMSGILLDDFVGPHRDKLFANIKNKHNALTLETNEDYKKQAHAYSTDITKQLPHVKKNLEDLSKHLAAHIALHFILYFLLPVLFPVMLYYGTRFAIHHYYQGKIELN